MKTTLFVSALIGSLAVAAIDAQQPPAARAAAAAPTPEVRSKHVQGDVWMINAGFVNVAVQVGSEGVLVVDTGTEAVAPKILAEIQKLSEGKPIRYIVNTHSHADHTGGNVTIAKAGKSIIAGNFAPQAGAEAANQAKIVAHENVQLRMSEGEGKQPPVPTMALPTDTFFTKRFDLYFDGEAVQLLHQPNAHTDGDVIAYFRKSDVIAAGDVYINTTFPVINVEQGGTLNGIVAALNRIIEITVPKDKQEGGTYVIPGHGHLADEADVVEYRDMVTILRDRFQDAVKKGMTLEQVKAARLVRDYEGRYGATQGFWTTDAFIEAAYKSLSAAKPAARQTSR
jgi:cyclase